MWALAPEVFFEIQKTPSVIIRAAKIIPAPRADQLAMVPSQLLSAIGANLAVVVHCRRGAASRLTM
jgi:hypothetical protein